MLEGNVDSERLSRVQLLELAQTLRISDADVMTRAELRAAIEQARRPAPRPASEPFTWLGVARRLLASIVEQGLNLPDAAALIRGDTKLSAPPKPPPPVATVTLARIYAAQGHIERAISTLDEVLTSDPDHDLARDLRDQLHARLEEQRLSGVAPAPSSPDTDEDDALCEEPSPESARAEPAPNAAAPVSPAAFAAPDPPSTEPPPPSIAVPDPPSAELAPPSPDPAPPSVDAAPADASSTSTSPAPPPSEAEPALEALPPCDAETAGTAAVAAPTAATEPRDPALLVLETPAPTAYVYWELGSRTGELAPTVPHWISVVVHEPTPHGARRHERLYPVFRGSGALRVEGLPPGAVVRAKLTRDAEAGAGALCVAANVRASEPREGAPVEVRFSPGRSQDIAPLASRAMGSLANASPAYF